MHIEPFDNQNQPIVDVGNDRVPLNYFNIVKLRHGEHYSYQLSGYESCVVPATGRVSVKVENKEIAEVGLRTEDVWDGEPEGVYVPTGLSCIVECLSETAEVFVAGAKFDQTLAPFAVLADDIDMVQYGSDDTKTHRKIKHILGQKQHGLVGRLLVSELLPSARAVGLDSQVISTQWIERARLSTMKRIIFGLSQMMVALCSCCNALIQSLAKLFMLWMVRPSLSMTDTIRAAFFRVVKCITSRS